MLFWIHVNIKWSGYFLTSKKFYRSSTLIAPIRHSAAYQNLIVFHQACCLVAGLDCRTIIIYYGLPCCCSDPQLQAYALSHPWAIMSNSAPDAVCTRYTFWRSILFLKLFYTPKDQLISKQNCGAVTSPKRWKKRTQNSILSAFRLFFWTSYG